MIWWSGHPGNKEPLWKSFAKIMQVRNVFPNWLISFWLNICTTIYFLKFNKICIKIFWTKIRKLWNLIVFVLVIVVVLDVIDIIVVVQKLFKNYEKLSEIYAKIIQIQITFVWILGKYLHESLGKFFIREVMLVYRT